MDKIKKSFANSRGFYYEEENNPRKWILSYNVQFIFLDINNSTLILLDVCKFAIY